MMKNAIVSCVVLGILALGFSPLAAQDEPFRPPRPWLGMGAGFQKWLDLTPEQEAKLKDMRAVRFEENKAFFEKLNTIREELRQAMQDPKADRKKVEGLVDEMHRVKAAQMKAHLKFRKDMETVFTPEQLEKLKKAGFRAEEMRRAGRFQRRHPGLRGMRGPGGFGFRGDRHPWGRGFGPGWRWDW